MSLRVALSEQFKAKDVPHQPLILGTHSAGAESVAVLMVEVGVATAMATAVLLEWWAARRRIFRVSIILDDGRGNRRKVQIEAPDSSEIPLLLAQAREVILEKAPSKRAKPKDKRVKLPAVLRVKLIDEVRSHCPNPACGKSGVRNLEAHHIDGDRSRTVDANLLMLCRNCHGEADNQLISREMVGFWKKLVAQGLHPFLDDPSRKMAKSEAPVVDGVNQGHAARHMEFHYHDTKPPAELPGVGTIGADPQRRAYVYYLGQRYIEWRLKGKTEMGDERDFSEDAAWSVIRKKLGFAPYKAGLESFPTVVEVITAMIDQTVFGSLNASKGIRNYHTFEEHCAKMVRRRKPPKNS